MTLHSRKVPPIEPPLLSCFVSPRARRAAFAGKTLDDAQAIERGLFKSLVHGCLRPSPGELGENGVWTDATEFQADAVSGDKIRWHFVRIGNRTADG